MKDLSYAEVVCQSKALPLIKRSVLTVRNIPVEPIFSDYLHYFSISSSPDFCDEKEVFSSQKEYDLALILLNLPRLIQNFYDEFYRKSVEDIQFQLQFLDKFLNQLFSHLNKTCRQVIFFSFFPEPYEGQEEWNTFVFSANERAKKQAINQCIFIDLLSWPMTYGWKKLFCSGSDLILKSQYQTFFFEKIAQTVKKTLVPSEKQIKCIVLDCDGVLWGGILSEDGVDGIHLGKDGIGRFFRLFQREILHLIRQGIIVTLCSKNNKNMVIQAFNEHPEMLLKWTDIVDCQINWRNKAENIQFLANRLSFRLEQLLFIDDNPHEISLVNQILPQVQTLQLDSSRPEEYISRLYSFSFSVSKESKENAIRARSYQQNLQRDQQKKDFSSIEEFNSYYNTICNVRAICKEDIGRIVHLSQRSNQFNLSVMRFSFPQLEKMLKDKNYEILCMEVKDDFGDLGLIGISTIHYAHEFHSACIDSFILSCRALGRKLEDRFMEEVLNIISQKKVKNITALVKETEKNKEHVGFYQQFPIITIQNF